MKKSLALKKPTKYFKETDITKSWYVFDADGKTLGRFASEVAKVLKGKHHAEYTPNQDLGDGVIVLNAGKIQVTGSKAAQKIYYRHSGHIGGLKEIPYLRMLDRHPERVIWLAVKGMMPKTKLGRKMLKKLRVFKDSNHNMEAQKPIQVQI